MGKKRQAGSVASTPAKKPKLSRGDSDQAETRYVITHPARLHLREADRVPIFREVTSVYTGRKSDEQEDFPRGGQGALSALEKRLIREKAKQEVLFSEVHPYCCGDCLSSAEE